MLEGRQFLPEDEARYQSARDILCNKKDSDPLTRIVAHCSLFWLQLKIGEKSFLTVAQEMSKYLDLQEKKHPKIYSQFTEELDQSGFSMAIKLREEILGPGNLKKYQQSFKV